MEILDQLLAKATGVTSNSREIGPGYIFVAIRGRTTDGNRFAADAALKGAQAIVSDCPDNLPPLEIPVLVVPNARRTLAELAAVFYQHPSRNLSLVGITGTNGKTTVAFMLDHIFRTAGFSTGLIGTISINIGNVSFPSTLTTPDAATLQQYLAAMRQQKVSHAVMEVSAQGIEMQRVHNVSFSCGILTNVSTDHLDFHGTFPAYLAAKSNFPALLGSEVPLIINNADHYCRTIAARHSGPLITVALEDKADITIKILNTNNSNSSFTLTLTNPLPDISSELKRTDIISLQLRLPGRHNIENAALAAAAALLHGVSPTILAKALSTFSAVPRRMEIFHHANITILDDTALNPGSINAIFETLCTFPHRHLIVVNAIRGCRGAAINSANALAMANWRQKLSFSLIITSSLGATSLNNTVTTDEKSAFLTTLENSNTPYIFTNTLSSAILSALDAANPGDIIALLGAQGMDDGYKILSQLIHTNRQRTFDQTPLETARIINC
ncbi:MAG: murE 1 [Firmicutes bacterium]|nr:murE 1 [Bacillota bacterium]